MKRNTDTFLSKLRLWMIRGALFMLPIWLSVFIVGLAYQLSETWLGGITRSIVHWVLPTSVYAGWFPDGNIPGLSLLTGLLLLAFVGAVASWHIGRQGLRIIDYLFLSIPGISSIYSSVRKMVDSIGDPGQSRFQKVVFVEWPNKGVRAVGFVTNELPPDANGDKRYMVFIPHMPNPTSGFVLLVNEKNTIETDMTPDEGLKYCLSLGVLTPPSVPLEKL
jgi:uncharacterized membrane protein